MPAPLLLIGVLVVFLVAAQARADAAAEVCDALGKLHRTSYRQRDYVAGMYSGLGGAVSPVVYEHVGDRTRLVSEINLPSLGVIRTERITVGSRATVRTTAPGLLAKLEESRRRMTVSSAKSLLQQIAAAASAVQTGGLTTASWIAEASRAALTVKSTADARAALDRAIAGFQSWQPVAEEGDETVPPSGLSASSVTDHIIVEKTSAPSGSRITYRCTPADAPSAGVYSTLIVDTKTGYPVAEEQFVGGQRMMRTEYYDFGSPIIIEVPESLR
ncbi:MAG TPA: hypothetical protein VM165_09575 [Planctomycetaceae bacterium]|nr:hypothetical protein [Planctomycetaceae bacterium]